MSFEQPSISKLPEKKTNKEDTREFLNLAKEEVAGKLEELERADPAKIKDSIKEFVLNLSLDNLKELGIKFEDFKSSVRSYALRPSNWLTTLRASQGDPKALMDLIKGGKETYDKRKEEQESEISKDKLAA